MRDSIEPRLYSMTAATGDVDESSPNAREDRLQVDTELDSYPSPLPSPAPNDTLGRRATSALSQNTVEISNGGSDRVSRRRSIMDPRSSRFSGFISNLIRRDRDRERDLLQPEQATAEQSSSPVVPPSSSVISPPAPRPVTPPPPLYAPTLYELGLSLSVLTANLSPSHLTTSPTGGTFLAPHYLLLCHAQGLDVLPLKRPPAPQPYALVRRVPFKSVVIMEERGVMVAIAGRRDGVRVYALEEVKKAIEWRMDFEVRKEIEKSRREDAKRGPTGLVDNIFAPITTPTAKDNVSHPGNVQKMPSLSVSSEGNPAPVKNASLPTRRSQPKPPPKPPSPPPQYDSSPDVQRPSLNSGLSGISIYQNPTHRASAANLFDMPNRRNRPRQEEKPDGAATSWAGASDDEAIDIVAAGPSGSAALDERTSVASMSRRQTSNLQETAGISGNTEDSSHSGRPSNGDLSSPAAVPSQDAVSPPPLSLTSLRETLSRSSPLAARDPIVTNIDQPSDGSDIGGTSERISFAQALLESRLPDIPPPGTRRPQLPVLISASHPVVVGDEEITPVNERRPHTASSIPHQGESTGPKNASRRSERLRRRRWTVLDGAFSTQSETQVAAPVEPKVDKPVPAMERRPSFNQPLAHATSQSSLRRTTSVRQGQTSSSNPNGPDSRQEGHTPTPLPTTSASRPSSTRTNASANRFIPRIITNALNNRRSTETIVASKTQEEGPPKRNSANSSQSAAPKLEYVKLPGTKGSMMIKAVETAKKSFLAILCGENGEKIELFAGTYRTALGLSRTFILPDSPRNIELQLQGDDLVEVFLVFSHNVFGLEPATVRVREVRIGRAERRAARRRAREARIENETQENDFMAMAEDDNAPVGSGLDIPEANEDASTTAHASGRSNPIRPTMDSGDAIASPAEPAISATTNTAPDDLVALAAAQIGSYTTFQQLSFAPNFPLAAIANEWIIPPTYPKVLEHYPKVNNTNINGGLNEDNNLIVEEQQVLPPPGLPVPLPSPPSKWYYKDPKGVVRGPWKASLMQSWYKDGYLPLDLPVRRENETEYITLQDLRLRSVDPNNPFKGVPVSAPLTPAVNDGSKAEGPLLAPVSLLAQPRHYGPPALFFSSRGGHSTSIVDVRGRSVLKNRFFWSIDDDDEHGLSNSKLGDITRIESFDIRGRAVIVALRQGGLEALDVGDAVLFPGDESREALPDFQIAPPTSVGRRGTYTWRIGSPVTSAPVSSPQDASAPALTIVRKKHTHNTPTSGRIFSKSDGSYLTFDDNDTQSREEIIFLGRRNDDVYFCERSTSSFRILCLAPFS